MGEYVTVDIGGRRLYAHRILVQRWLGRSLAADEVVHHVDNDGTNNAPSNLQVATRSTHAKAHMRSSPPFLIPGIPTLARAAARYDAFRLSLLKPAKYASRVRDHKKGIQLPYLSALGYRLKIIKPSFDERIHGYYRAQLIWLPLPEGAF